MGEVFYPGHSLGRMASIGRLEIIDLPGNPPPPPLGSWAAGGVVVGPGERLPEGPDDDAPSGNFQDPSCPEAELCSVGY